MPFLYPKTAFFSLFFCLLTASNAMAQSDAVPPEVKAGELILQLDGDASLERVLAYLNNRLPEANVFALPSRAADWHIFRIGFDPAAVPDATLLALARQTPGVRLAQRNHRVSDRDTEPNDPDWWRQDDMTLIGAPKAWDASTGGLTPQGDTIVIAVLEKGALLTHPDLNTNRWFNYKEIPGNNKDDDNNGYIDDFLGWDARFDGDGPGNTGTHGTSVNGIIGANGNNNLGVTGVNWTVQLMNISNVEYENEIIDAYRYVKEMRDRYNKSNGQDGAFVVATNASFGIDREKAEDHPVWCAIYDSLGKVGVLSIGATSNSNVNVDVEGDMPTSCPSEFLITVNNLTKLDQKAASTGYGAVSIDLGAPGQDTYTTANAGMNPVYGTLGGTSAAAPHVTGAAGLLYSMNCPTLALDAKTNPAACVRRFRDLILNSAKPVNSLQNITTTGGRLDLAAAVDAVNEFCGGARGPLDILELNPNPARDMIRIRYQTPAFTTYQIRIFNILGALVYETTVNPQPFEESTLEVPVQIFPTGVYVISIGIADVVKSKKFVKM